MALNKFLFQTNLLKSLTIFNGKPNVRFSKSTAASETETESDTANDDSSAVVLFEDDEDGTELKEQLIEKHRNKSRLRPQDLNRLHNTMPYQCSSSWIHETIKYKRMMFGRYGLASGVDPRLCFYSNTEIDAIKDYENVAYPFTIQQMMEENTRVKSEKEAKIRKREDDIDKKLGKLAKWTTELHAKSAKREADAKAAKERKERLVEEVRRQFGFKLDVRTDRFKELVAQKEKADKKKEKEERRKMKEEKMLAKLQQRAEVGDGEPPSTPSKSEPPSTPST